MSGNLELRLNKAKFRFAKINLLFTNIKNIKISPDLLIVTHIDNYLVILLCDTVS